MELNGSGPLNVGIKGIELYFPKSYIDQRDFAKFIGGDEKKYLNGLCLREMSFCDDNEDVCTLALTVTSGLLKSYKIDPKSIGLVVVGTESLIDKSKSVKTTLMPLFGENTDIEGVDHKNACYGGTQALLHAVDWVYSRYGYEGKSAIVVMTDIAIYEPGSDGECTGGAGAIAVLIGPNAPLILEVPLISTHMSNCYDFYKPICGTSSEFPRVDGKNSVDCYLGAVENCYKKFKQRSIRYHGETCSSQNFYATIFHCPYFQLVKKAFAQVYRLDCEDNMINGHEEHLNLANGGEQSNRRDSYWRDASTSLLEEKVSRFVDINQRIGNMYTASLYASLVSVVASCSTKMHGQRILLFSYGSGLAASMFSLRLDLSNESQKSELEKMCQISRQNKARLDQRTLKTPEEYRNAIQRRTNQIQNIGKFDPKTGVESLFPNTYYIKEIDPECRRTYAEYKP